MTRIPLIQRAVFAGVLGAAGLAGCGGSKDTTGPTAGAAVKIAPTTLTTQVALINAAITVKPTVKVTDNAGIGVPNVSVTFAITGGGGAITGATQQTNGGGVATVGSWTMGAGAGFNTLTATVTGLTGSPVTFRGRACGMSTSFQIRLVYLQQPTAPQLEAFDGAAAHWSCVIIGELTDVVVNKNQNACGVGDPAMTNQNVDDLQIFVSLVPIDGVGGTLGQAGPCFIRNSNKLTVVGIMKFDTADLGTMLTNGTLDDVILHEMGHVLGFGGLWDDPTKNLILNAGSADPTFTGAQALAAFDNTNGGNTYVGAKIPVENTGGPGTADSHWRESVFDDELMTGFISSPGNPLSLTTVESFVDLGYTANGAEADGYTLPAPPPFASTSSRPRVSLGDDIRHGPIYVVRDNGQVVQTINR